MVAKPTRVKRRYVLMRQEIVQAARQIIRERGIDGLSMRAIAKLVHTSPANLYEYFLNKEEIIISVYNDFLEGLLETLQGIAQVSSGREYLLALCMSYIDYVSLDPSQLQIASYPVQFETFDIVQEEPDKRIATAVNPGQSFSTQSQPNQSQPRTDAQRSGTTYPFYSQNDTLSNPIAATYLTTTKQIFALFLQAVEKSVNEKSIVSQNLGIQEITHITWAFVHGLVTLSIQDVSIIDRNTMQTAINNFFDGLSA